MLSLLCFFFNDTATTEIYTLSLHDALPISGRVPRARAPHADGPHRHDHRRIRHRQGIGRARAPRLRQAPQGAVRSEEHTSELQSRQYLVCRLLLEKKKKHTHFEIKCTMHET